MELALSVAAWSAWSSSKPERADWENWAAGRTVNSEGGAKPDVSMVPAMKRRRMSSLSRMAFATALDCLGDSDIKPVCVFATRHGELLRTINIIESLVEGKDISPTDFSLSVHNTALGMFSIFTDNKLPATTVVAGIDTFGAALIEAAVHRHRFPDRHILLVFFDEPLPSPLNSLQVGPAEACSISLLLSPTQETNLVIGRRQTKDKSSEHSDRDINLAEDFLKFYLGTEAISEITTPNAVWRWSRP